MKYRARYSCGRCGDELTYQQVVGSCGVCPLCGHITEGTVCSHTKRAAPVEPKGGGLGVLGLLWEALKAGCGGPR